MPRALPVVNDERQCSKCKTWKAVATEFPKREEGRKGNHTVCKECTRAYLRKWRGKNPDANSFWYRQKLGVTPERFYQMAHEQGYVCAVCLEEPKFASRGDGFHVDHDHATGKVRGLLCRHCNRLLGCAKDRVAVLENAIKYLRRQEH